MFQLVFHIFLLWKISGKNLITCDNKMQIIVAKRIHKQRRNNYPEAFHCVFKAWDQIILLINCISIFCNCSWIQIYFIYNCSLLIIQTHFMHICVSVRIPLIVFADIVICYLKKMKERNWCFFYLACMISIKDITTSTRLDYAQDKLYIAIIN